MQAARAAFLTLNVMFNHRLKTGTDANIKISHGIFNATEYYTSTQLECYPLTAQTLVHSLKSRYLRYCSHYKLNYRFTSSNRFQHCKRSIPTVIDVQKEKDSQERVICRNSPTALCDQAHIFNKTDKLTTLSKLWCCIVVIRVCGRNCCCVSNSCSRPVQSPKRNYLSRFCSV